MRLDNTADSQTSRALILEPSGNLWGSERVLLDFLCAATQFPWRIGVCCPPNSPILTPLGELPVEVFPTFRANLHLQGRTQRLLATLALLRTARHFRPDLIYVNQAGATRIALAVGYLLSIPVITHVRLVEDVDYVLSLGARPQNLPKIVCISRYIRRLFPDEKNVSPEQLEMLYDPYTFQSSAQRIVASGLEREGELISWGYVGRLEYQKRPDILLEAMGVLKEQGVLTRGFFMGVAREDDAFSSQLQELCTKLGLGSIVTWAGFQTDVFSQLSRCIALVCPFEKEALGRVVFEAWDASVLPVAWAGSGGPAEVIRDSGGGLLYEHQNGDCLAETLKKIIGMSQVERDIMIERGRAWLQEHCNPKNYAHQMLTLWQEVVETS